MLTGPVSGSLVGLNSIRSINISCNSFNGNLFDLGEFPNLSVLNLSSNSFAGGLNSQICISSNKIQILDLSMNHLSGGLDGLGNCNTSLQLMAIEGQILDSLYSASSLEHLSISANNFSGQLRPQNLGYQWKSTFRASNQNEGIQIQDVTPIGGEGTKSSGANIQGETSIPSSMNTTVEQIKGDARMGDESTFQYPNPPNQQGGRGFGSYSGGRGRGGKGNPMPGRGYDGPDMGKQATGKTWAEVATTPSRTSVKLRLSTGGFENRNWRVECSEFIYSVRRVVRCGLSGNSPIVISNSIAGLLLSCYGFIKSVEDPCCWAIHFAIG
ncbi:Phytosulfokine receptor 2 [Camellia lanceoleosa]|uniref:Phytosulfokine receptor 2 n=1 Tax=Camellia lanceoleosa TaxID=1840588 RepID=A0ACC0GWM8_9ERIC|nr:Phytosulfokine receptor 2 [Camellia lanceoleosa]